MNCFKTKLFAVAIFCLTSSVYSNEELTEFVNDVQVEHAIKDLTERLSPSKVDITILSKKSMTWRSGALGCPRPYEQYTQALVPGVLIHMQAGNKVYRYHANTNGVPFYCPDKFAEDSTIKASDL